MMKRGFTLIEIIVAIAVVLIVSYLILTSLPKITSTQALSKETANLIAVLNQARSQTLASKSDTNYGIHLASSQVTIFRGSVYSSIDVNNVVIVLDPKVYLSSFTLTGGGSDIIFDRQTGRTSQPGSITVALVASSTQNKIISVSSTGIVDGTP